MSDWDLVVVGFGAAGAACALTAAEAGARVLVLEKQPEHAHTPSTRMSGGMAMAVHDVEAAATYLDACAGGMVPADVSRRWAETAERLPEWLAKHGMEFTRIGGAEHPELPGAEAIDVLQPGTATGRLDPSAGAGPRLWEWLLAAVTASSTEVRWSSPAVRLTQDADGRVDGVLLADGEAVRSRHGVVLTCGGYEYDENLKLDHLRVAPVHFYGNPGNTGDGVRMAQALGADLWHMNQMVGRAIGSFPLDDGSRMQFIIGIDPPGYVITDRHGRRFADESSQARLLHGFYYELLALDVETGQYPRVPCYWFFDETRRLAGPLTYSHIGAVAVGMYDWSADNSAEIERGWIHAGATVEEAAAAAGVLDPAAAAASVAAYNAACRDGSDEFRAADTLVPIERGPFYCVPLWPGGSNTTGGPRRDADCRVQHVFGGPIPGLYAAGELGQASGLVYPSDGSNISEALCFGQVAARTALT